RYGAPRLPVLRNVHISPHPPRTEPFRNDPFAHGKCRTIRNRAQSSSKGRAPWRHIRGVVGPLFRGAQGRVVRGYPARQLPAFTLYISGRKPDSTLDDLSPCLTCT